MNTNSPANMLPNSRMPCETVLAVNSIICISEVDQGYSEDGLSPNGRRHKLVRPAAQALDLDVVEQADQQHAERQAQGGGQVGGGHDAQVGWASWPGAERCARPGSRSTGSMSMAFIRKIQTNTVRASGATSLRLWRCGYALGLIVDHLVQHFDRGLEAAGHTRRRLARHATTGSSRSHPAATQKRMESMLKTEKSTMPFWAPFCACCRW